MMDVRRSSLSETMIRARRLSLMALCVAVVALAACSGEKGADATGPKGDPQRGQQAVERFGCGACHVIPGIEGANSRVGPSLAGIASRPQLAGGLANTPDNLRRWVQHPQAVKPGSAMPDLGIGDQDALDITAYLLR